MNDDFTKYVNMNLSGASPREVCECAIRDNIDPMALYRLMRSVFNMNLNEAKTVITMVDWNTDSLDEEEIVKSLKGKGSG